MSENVLYFQPPSKRTDAEKLTGARDMAKRLRWQLQTVESLPDAKTMKELIAFWNPVGAVVESDGWRQECDWRPFAQLPSVFIDLSEKGLPSGCCGVSQDSFLTGMTAGRELLESGRASLAFVPFPGNPTWSRDRERGFRKALKINGKTCATFEPPSCETESLVCRTALRDFLVKLPKPCAVFAANDEIAGLVASIATLAGIRIPGDLALIGVDNYDEICEHVVPTITSIDPDFRRGGELAMLTLAALVRDGKRYRGSRINKFGIREVVRRASTRIVDGGSDEVERALEMIRLGACQGLTAEEVLATFRCSRPKAIALFHAATGVSVLQEIHAVQLKRAKELVEDPSVNLKAVSDFCGFSHPNSLRKFFLRETGMTMTEWRKRTVGRRRG